MSENDVLSREEIIRISTLNPGTKPSWDAVFAHDAALRELLAAKEAEIEKWQKTAVELNNGLARKFLECGQLERERDEWKARAERIHLLVI